MTSEQTTKKRVAIVNSHPIQYFAPLYEYMGKDPDIEVTALYLSDSSIRGEMDASFGHAVKWDIDLLSGYKSKFIGKNYKTNTPAGFFSLVNPALFSEIVKGKYDAVLIHGYNYAANIVALAAAKVSGTPIFMRGETHLKLRRVQNSSGLRNFIMRRLFARFDGMLAIGTLNAEYYEAYGVPKDRIFQVPYTVDNARFKKKSAMNARERKKARKEFGIDPELPAVLYISKFQERKHPDDVLRAAKRLQDEGLKFQTVMAGSGDMDSQLRALAKELKLDHVVFPGFMNQSQMPRLLGACDVLTLPSEEEPWGLIVNEAMCSGLPVIVGDEVGSTHDIVNEGVNGYAVVPGDVDSLTDAMRATLIDPEKREAMAKASLDVIDKWSYRECLDGWRAALKLPPREAPKLT